MTLARAVAVFFIVMIARPCQAQWTVSIYTGALHTLNADLTIDQPSRGIRETYSSVEFQGRSWDSPIYYGYRIGHPLPHARWISIEGELIHGKVFARPFSARVQRFAMSHGLNFILMNAVVRRPLTDRITLTARGGAGPALPHGETAVDGQTVEGYTVAGVTVQLSGGVELRIAPRLNLLAEYKWTRAHPRIPISNGTASMIAQSHHVVFGVAGSF